MLIFGVMFYEIYLLSFNQHKEKAVIGPKKKYLPPIHRNEKKRKKNNDKQISTYLSNNLKNTKAKASQLVTDIVSPDEIPSDLMAYTHLSLEDEFESSALLPYDGYNHLINEDDIDFIFPSNDKDLFNILHSTEFLTNWDTAFLGDDYWNFIGRLDAESKKDVNALRKKFESLNKSSNRKQLSSNFDLLTSSSKSSKYYDFNGLSSDLALFSKGTESVGSDGLYWFTSNDCIQHKACTIYPIHRILQKSKQISCNEILNDILPNIYECIAQKGKKCENVIDSGYYRVIMKTIYEKTGEEIVIKMMKTKSIKKDRDLMRHVREAILLGTLFDEEREFMADASNKNALFTQTLFGRERQRAFNYVEEYGHCVLPLWISVSPLYRTALDKWIEGGFASKSTLKKLVFMSLQIAKSVEIIHTIRGGPYHHTDIQPRQFLLDDFDNVYINDFNRGKFQPFYFDEVNKKVTKCWYCGHRSRGHWRAPEEPKKRPLNEKLDIFSMGLTIWSLYSNDVPFKKASFDELPFLYYELRRKPEMTPNIPPAIKDIIRSCLRWDPRQRPTATQVVEMFEDVYFDKLKIITEGFADYTSDELMKAEVWKQTNYPPLEERRTPNDRQKDSE